MKSIKEIEKDLNSYDFAEISPGVFIEKSKSLIEQQKTWCDEDESKSIDFESYPYWITTDNGAEPYPVDTIQEATDYIIERYRFETGNVFEYSGEHNAYIFIGKKIGYSKEELMKMMNAKCTKDHVLRRKKDEEEDY